MRTQTGFFWRKEYVIQRNPHKIEITQIIHTERFKAIVSPIKAAGLHWYIHKCSLWKQTGFVLKYFDNWQESCQWKQGIAQLRYK